MDVADGLLVVDLSAPEPAATICNRSGLIHALTEAAELEHGLMIQYLFAAFTMRTGEQEGLSVPERERLRRWQADILRVAREEMAHLATVGNLLTAIGGAPHFRRPNMPAKGRYFPQGGTYRPFSLEPFSLATIERFIAFEQPHRVPGEQYLVEPQLAYGTVGCLYHQIKEALKRLDDGGLFVTQGDDQDDDERTAAMKIGKVTDLKSARAAVTSIVNEGEGLGTGGVSSHWECFKQIRTQLIACSSANPAFEPARPVMANPLTRLPAGAATADLVDHPVTKPIAELFNWIYATVLLMLMEHSAYAGETNEQREGLQATIRRMMSGVLRPLGEILTERPAHPKPGSVNAGPSFELYADLRLPSSPSRAWMLFSERLDEAAAACGSLATKEGAAPRLGIIHEHLRLAAGEADRLRPGA